MITMKCILLDLIEHQKFDYNNLYLNIRTVLISFDIQK